MKEVKKSELRIENLETKPPKDLPQLYLILAEEAKVVLKELQLLENEFYSGKTPRDYLLSYSQLMKSIMNSHKLTEINSIRQIQSVIFFARDPEVHDLYPDIGQISQEDSDALSSLQHHLLAYVPGRFTLVVDKLSKMQSICERYMKSFYSFDSSTAIETAKKYANNIRTWNTQVFNEIRNILYNPHLFIRESISLARMHSNSIELLRKTDMLTTPFMALFADEVEHLKEALRLINEWISHDRQYHYYLKNDLVDLEKKKNDLLHQIKTEKHKLHMSQFRVKSLQAEKAKLYVDIESVKEREAELLVEEESLLQEVNQTKIDLEIKEFRREEIRRELKEGKITEHEAHMQLHRLIEQIRVMKLDIPVMDRKLTSLKSKIELIEQKHKRLQDVNKSLQETDKLALKLNREVGDVELELDKIQNKITLCLEYYRLKTAPDVLEKLFYDLPLETKKSQEAGTQKLLQQVLGSPRKTGDAGRNGTVSSSGITTSSSPSSLTASSAIRVELSSGNSNDSCRTSMFDKGQVNLQGTAFDQCCLLVAHNIDRDWKRLYRALPFVPQRGRETIDNDIYELETTYIGDSLFECAWRSLQRWRRFHRRSKLAELRAAVERIRRLDIVTDVNEFLKPPGSKMAKEKTVPGFVKDDLIPYYRQVDRYDELRTSQKS